MSKGQRKHRSKHRRLKIFFNQIKDNEAEKLFIGFWLNKINRRLTFKEQKIRFRIIAEQCRYKSGFHAYNSIEGRRWLV